MKLRQLLIPGGIVVALGLALTFAVHRPAHVLHATLTVAMWTLIGLAAFLLLALTSAVALGLFLGFHKEVGNETAGQSDSGQAHSADWRLTISAGGMERTMGPSLNDWPDTVSDFGPRGSLAGPADPLIARFAEEARAAAMSAANGQRRIEFRGWLEF